MSDASPHSPQATEPSVRCRILSTSQELSCAEPGDTAPTPNPGPAARQNRWSRLRSAVLGWARRPEPAHRAGYIGPSALGALPSNASASACGRARPGRMPRAARPAPISAAERERVRVRALSRARKRLGSGARHPTPPMERRGCAFRRNCADSMAAHEGAQRVCQRGRCLLTGSVRSFLSSVRSACEPPQGRAARAQTRHTAARRSPNPIPPPLPQKRASGTACVCSRSTRA